MYDSMYYLLKERLKAIMFFGLTEYHFVNSIIFEGVVL